MVLSRNNGLVKVGAEVMFIDVEGVAGRAREVEGMGGDAGGELGVPTDFTRREGGVGASAVEWGESM